jgi:signal transduction histidine kinase/ActR/RegA family two-component response regulator
MNVAIQQQYMQAALIVSLLSVWLLVGLFHYLNRYTKRDYFTIWTAAWLFYALWLTLSFNGTVSAPGSILFTLRVCCVSISAAFLMWGSLRFLGLPVSQTLFGLFMLFQVVWTFLSPHVLASKLQVEIPVFMLLGMGSLFAGVCFYRQRKKMPFVGAGMLSLGFLLWGVYLITYPISQAFQDLYRVGFFVAAVLQLFIAVSMIVLVMEEVRYHAEQLRAEAVRVRSEKEALQLKVITAEEQCKSLFDRVRISEGLQEAYNELRSTQQAVVQQERLRALGQMASGIAHDINNALSPIVAYSDMLMAKTADLPESSRRFLGIIRQSGEDIARIVARLREFYRSRSESEPLVEVDIKQVLDEVITLTRPRWRDLPQRSGTSIKVVSEVQPNLPCLLSDATELREALTNLIFNAVDAMPQGGVITLAAFAVEVTKSAEGGAAERCVRLEVRDNGHGMDEKTRQRCLEPFFSTKAQRGGTGLGLAMVYGMMQRHEGTIEIGSTPGQGTCVTMTFPPGKPPDAVPAPAVEALKPRSLSLLCIDDELKVRQLMEDCLSQLGHEVTVAISGKQGVELFRSAQPTAGRYEAVITDLGMPDFDGNKVAEAIKAISPTTPIIMMTGWGALMKSEGEKAPDIDALVSKPPRIAELNRLLLQLTLPAVAEVSLPKT